MNEIASEELVDKFLKEKGINILFLHRDFPGQFKNLVLELAKNPLNLILFISAENDCNIIGVNRLVYPPVTASGAPEAYFTPFEEDVLHGQSAANLALAIKNRGIKIDVIFGHSWGPTLFMKDIFPNVPLICYFEWFRSSRSNDPNFYEPEPTEDISAMVRCKNASSLIDLYSCDGGMSPTNWQKKQFPKEFHEKIKVIPDGVDTENCKPNPEAKFLIKDKNLELTTNDEVITYATRGMEPFRGFPEFMRAVKKLQQKRPNAHFVIAGKDEVCYGAKLEKGTYKELMLKELDLDMSRVHFVGPLLFGDYVKLLQVSSVHFYSTVPFVLSWSILDAMAIGCCIVASNTQPVLEFIQDNYNGLLFNFFNVDEIVEKIEYALNNKNEMVKIRANARKTILDNYALKDVLPKQIEFIKSFIK